MKNTYKVYIADKTHDVIKISDSDNINNIVYDTKEKGYYKALEKAKKQGSKII